MKQTKCWEYKISFLLKQKTTLFLFTLYINAKIQKIKLLFRVKILEKGKIINQQVTNVIIFLIKQVGTSETLRLPTLNINVFNFK